MEIVKIKLSDITPYSNNAKEHPKEQIEQIKASIKELGFNDPIAVWGEKNIICAGHGRYLALKELGKEEAECIRLDHLTDEERKAYTLIHNKLTMNSDFDNEILEMELESIESIDMSFFDFELPEIIETADEDFQDEEEQEKENERERTYKQYNLQYNDIERTVGKYQMPIIEKQLIQTPKQPPIGFNYMLSTEGRDRGLHCFLDDYQIERLWNNPEMYAEKLIEFPYLLSPDYSLYLDMPIAMQIWNTYRSRLVGQIMQDYGVTVIPTISWGLPESFDFCFDGIEQGSIVAVSTIGVKRNEEQYKIWCDGMDEMIKRIKPSAIWVYGGKVEYDYKGIKTTFFENEVTERMKLIGAVE